MSDPSKNKFPSVEETLRHPAFPTTVWALEPSKKGLLPVAKSRGGPVRIAWEIHGTGPIKLCLIMGLAAPKVSWQRQTKYFGHDHGDKYSVLILDNRGIGESDKPVRRYSTSDMALDTIEVLDHVGWTEDREVNLMGISLGGMIAQEIACLIPARLQSLSLLCTSSKFATEKALTVRIKEGFGLLLPKSLDRIVADFAHQIFTEGWLPASDAEILPSPNKTPLCGPAAGTSDGEYPLFESNFQRFQAEELVKRTTPGCFSSSSFLCQLLAAAGHHKSRVQLAEMADKIGRERIMVMHGTEDSLIEPINGERLIAAIKPGVGLVVEGLGHAPVMQMTKWFNGVMEERLGLWSKL